MMMVMMMMTMMIIVIMIMMLNMMMKIKMLITWSIIELGDPNIAWQQIQIIPTDDTNNDDDDDEGDDDYGDDKNQNGRNLANLKARSLRFCKVIDLDNSPGKIPMMMMITIIMVRTMIMMMIKMMMKIQMVIFRLIFELGAHNFTQLQIQIIQTDEKVPNSPLH